MELLKTVIKIINNHYFMRKNDIYARNKEIQDEFIKNKYG